MLSLKKNIDVLDREEVRFQSARECYLALLNALQEQAIEVTPELTRDFQVELRALHRELCGDPSLTALTRSQITAVEALQQYRQAAAACLAAKEDDLRGILDVLGDAAETLSGHNNAHSTRLKDFTSQLQAVARGSDLARMRLELTRRVEQFRATADTMWQENNVSVSQMQTQLLEFQKRLERAESRASTDALTGLMNRGEGETRLRRYIDSGDVVSVILIDLNGFKQVNDHWGHSAGDQVLKTFGKTLAQNVRGSDTVCRWGGDEFLVLLRGNEDVARMRATELRTKLRITDKLVILGKVIAVEVSASLGVAQARSGESMEDLLTRADAELYGHKKPSRAKAGGPVAV